MYEHRTVFGFADKLSRLTIQKEWALQNSSGIFSVSYSGWWFILGTKNGVTGEIEKRQC